MNLQETLQLAYDLTTNAVASNYSDASANSDALRDAFRELIGGRETLAYDDLYVGSPVYEIYKQIIPAIIHEGLVGDETFMALVNYHNVALGDDIEFDLEDKTELVVSEAAYGTDGIRRQRLGGKTSYSLETSFYVIKVYDEYKRFVAGRVKWAELMQKVASAMKRKLLDSIAASFVGLTSADLGGTTYYPAKDSAFNETNLLTIIAHVEAATGKKAVIVGSKLALHKITTAQWSEKAKEDVYNAGFVGKFNSTPLVEIQNRHAVGTDNFILPDDKLWIITSDAKPISVLNRGVGISYTNNPFEKADHTIDHFYGQEFGVGVLYSEKGMGIYEFA